MNIGKDVQIYKSEHCLTPFTGFLYKPVIMLPSNTRSWSEDRLRVVLLHELAHIKRKDPVIRVIARFVCAILWFVPPVWIAYNKMQIEEEKACDEAVIETGVKTSEYAGHIVDIARSTQGRILRLMLQNSFSKQSTLEPRIKNILRLRKITDHIRPDVFIRILAVCLVCLFVLHVVNPLSARENNRILKKDTTLEMIYGHWINEWDYNKWKASRTGQYMGKMIIRPNGSIQLLYTPECQELPFIGGNVFYEIENRYLDRDGNHYYEVALWGSITRPTHVIYELWRIDSSASTLEISWDYSQFPSQIDPNRYEYYTFYRK
jgi:hypothetical protein